MRDPHFTIRIDQTKKIHRTVQRLRKQQQDFINIQRKFRGDPSPSQKTRLEVFDEVLKELNNELGRLILNRAAEAASEKLGMG